MSAIQLEDESMVPSVTLTHRIVTVGWIFIGIIGASVSTIAGLAIHRAGLSGPLADPVVRVGWFDLSTGLAIGCLTTGLLLLIGSIAQRSGLVLGKGIFMIMSGLILFCAAFETLRDIGTTRGTGAALMVAGIIALFSLTATAEASPMQYVIESPTYKQ